MTWAHKIKIQMVVNT